MPRSTSPRSTRWWRTRLWLAPCCSPRASTSPGWQWTGLAPWTSGRTTCSSSAQVEIRRELLYKLFSQCCLVNQYSLVALIIRHNPTHSALNMTALLNHPLYDTEYYTYINWTLQAKVKESIFAVLSFWIALYTVWCPFNSALPL